ncbi:DsbA family protein [Demequina sp. B12]|uniref:DsbA family protein n=1 Tax=Demequina sp. B12 TaxID=2992757 RepID=UPI00237ACAEB|nr:thioredoxin domain-containing protein [Demequina sp. B12]MDE0573712.1 DsbA family protein [Demequina sp. B12]
MAKKNQQSSNSKAAAARAQAQAQVRAQERKTGVIIAAVVGVVVLVLAGLVMFIVNSGKVPGLDESGAVLPAGSDETGGIAVGTAGVVGEDVPDDVTRVDVYLDFMCPICHQFEQTNGEDLSELRESGEIALYYHPISILDRYSLGTQYSTRSANAAATVADRAPESFLDFVEALYLNQPAENTEGLTDEQIEQIAIDAGVPEGVAAQFEDGDFNKWVIAASDRSSQDGLSGTPSIHIAEAGQTFDEGAMVPQTEVPFMQAGVLRAHLESLS